MPPRIQKGNETAFDRYPDVFYVTKRYAEARSASDVTRILSFGCSTGEEPFCLAEKYFQNAVIIGVDASREVLEVATRNNTFPERVLFYHSTADLISQNGPYDVIFAMSVLCRWPESRDVEDISNLYNFNDFDEHVRTLDASLRPGGLLVIYNSNFNFMECSVSPGYDIVLSKHLKSNGYVKRFDRDNKTFKLEGMSDCIYVKRDEKAAKSLKGMLRFLNEDGAVIGALAATVTTEPRDTAIGASP